MSTAPQSHETRSGGGLIVVALSGAAVIAAWVLEILGSEAFRPYFGTRSPALVVAAVAVVAGACLSFLARGGWFVVHAPNRRGLLRAFLIASALAVPVVIVDLAGGFSADINVRLPDAVLFYPTIALVAETVFHVLPLSVLLLVLSPLRHSVPRQTVLWGCILVAALPEPIFQVAYATDSPPWAVAYVGLHLLVFNIVSLLLFKRFDFVTMYSFRFFYYALWHIVWGVIRLQVLF